MEYHEYENNFDAFATYHQRMALPRLVCNELEKQRGGQVSSPLTIKCNFICNFGRI